MDRPSKTVTRRERIFAPECDKCSDISDKEKIAIDAISNRVFQAVVKILNIRMVGTVLKPLVTDLIDGFVVEMDTYNLRGRHIGVIAQKVISRLDEYLGTNKK